MNYKSCIDLKEEEYDSEQFDISLKKEDCLDRLVAEEQEYESVTDILEVLSQLFPEAYHE